MDGSNQMKVYGNDAFTAHNAHGVTFMEKAKTPFILYLYTGDAAYLHAGHNAVGLMEKYHMLPDGVPRSCAGLFEDGPDLSHETCGISDDSWAAGHAMLATGETTWADQIERAVFTAGPGAVTKDFKAHQYYSALSQAVATADNYAGLAQYAPVHSPECCSGNVHRFMPNYVARTWLSAGASVATLYGPSRVSVRINGQDVSIDENTAYPFADNIDFAVHTKSPIEVPLMMRVPGWCDAATLQVNGGPADHPFDIGADAVTIDVPAKRMAEFDWPLRTEVGNDRTSVMTPWPEKWNVSATPTETNKLVPDGATCLRIAIFPDARQPRPAPDRRPPEIVPHRTAKAAPGADPMQVR